MCIDRPDDQRYCLDKITKNNDYNKDTLENDIALVKVSRPFDFRNASLISKIILSERKVGVKEKANCLGWGSITSPMRGNEFTFPNQLQRAEIERNSKEESVNMYLKREPIFDTNVCVMNEIHVTTCDGDSGGPLITNTSI